MKERGIIFSGALVPAILRDQKTVTRRVVRPQPCNPEVFGVSPVWGSGVPRPHVDSQGRFGIHASFNVDRKRVDRWLPCPYGAPGDRLWVRETWYCDDVFAGDHVKACVGCVRCKHTDEDRIGQWRKELYYRADAVLTGTICELIPECCCDGVSPWTPSIFMPRWASRITLEVTSVGIEPLQAITVEEVAAEGVKLPVSDEGCPPGKVWPLVGITGRCPPIEYLPRKGKRVEADYYRAEFASSWDALHGSGSWASNPWVWRVAFRRVDGR